MSLPPDDTTSSQLARSSDQLRFRRLSDASLIAAYQRTDGEPGDPEADALTAEIERRNLDL